jgi:hypothetical protein
MKLLLLDCFLKLPLIASNVLWAAHAAHWWGTILLLLALRRTSISTRSLLAILLLTWRRATLITTCQLILLFIL